MIILSNSPHSGLNVFKELCRDPPWDNPGKVGKVLRVHYRKKAASEIYQQLATAYQQPKETPQQFLLRGNVATASQSESLGGKRGETRLGEGAGIRSRQSEGEQVLVNIQEIKSDLKFLRNTAREVEKRDGCNHWRENRQRGQRGGCRNCKEQRRGHTTQLCLWTLWAPGSRLRQEHPWTVWETAISFSRRTPNSWKWHPTVPSVQWLQDSLGYRHSALAVRGMQGS